MDIPASKSAWSTKARTKFFERPPGEEIPRKRRMRIWLRDTCCSSALETIQNADSFVPRRRLVERPAGHGGPVIVVGRDPIGLQAGTCFAGAEAWRRWTGTLSWARSSMTCSRAFTRGLGLCVPLRIETFGLPILEAMACGAPVVGSDRTSVPEIVGDAGLCAESGRHCGPGRRHS